MKIYFGNTYKTVEANDNSYRYRAVKGEHSLTLYFTLAEYFEFPVGAWCEFPEGSKQRYTLEKPASFKKHSLRTYEYTMVMESAQAKLSRYKLRNVVDGRLKFSYTAKPHEFIQLLVDNLNQRDPGWRVGCCIEAVEKNIAFNHVFCSNALNIIAETFETEWEIDSFTKTIHLRKVEYNKDAPLKLSYGKGNGFKPGLGRANADNSRATEVLYVQGGDRNIDYSKYGSHELLLPRNKTYFHEGRLYVSDAEGFSIHRADKELKTFVEDSLDCSHIYPKRVGTVTSVIVSNKEKNYYDFVDETLAAEGLDYSKYLVAGESMTVVFQSGMLAGREFEVKYVHAESRFEIKPQEYDGILMPSETFKPRPKEGTYEGDKYVVFGISLPDEYICNDLAQTGASWDMFEAAAKYLYENENPHFSFTGELDGVWAKKDWLNIGGKIVLGGYVDFSDTEFQPDGILIRIVGIKEMLNNPYSPIIELSNVTTGATLASDLGKINQTEVVNEDTLRGALQFTKRKFRDVRETIDMLNDALLNFSASVSPIAVQTMSLLIGDESLQFCFVSSVTDPKRVAHSMVYDILTKTLFCEVGILQHRTIGINSLSSSHSPEEYRYWNIEEFRSASFTEAEKKYYLYAKVSRAGANGHFYLSEIPIGMKDIPTEYNLLVGILGSEMDGERSFVPLYGFTEIGPGRITVDMISSADGNNFMDFMRNAFRIGDKTCYLDWNNAGKNTLSTLKMQLREAIVKDRLSVLGEAFIAGFLFSDEIIRSTAKLTDGSSALMLDGQSGQITLKSEKAGGYESLYEDIGSTITLDSSSGVVEVRERAGNGSTSYLSPTGILSNNAGTRCYSVTSGLDTRAAIVGLGFGNLDKKLWDINNEEWIAGVFGTADNKGDAPAFGGFFCNLMASGFFLSTDYVSDTTQDGYVVDPYTSLVVGLSNKGISKKLYLPNDNVVGRTLFFKQIGLGNMIIYPQSGQSIFDDNSENYYYPIDQGVMLVANYCRFVQSGILKYAWLVSKFKF